MRPGPKRFGISARTWTFFGEAEYSILATSARDTRNAGDPGTTNPVVNETLEWFLIAKMFAQVAQGKLSAANLVRSTAREMKQIWAKWKTAGKI